MIIIDRLTKQYGNAGGNGKTILDSISLTVGDGEIAVILGPNGSGKTTLLQCIAELSAPTSGAAKIVADEPSRVGYVFQRVLDSLCPWMTVENHILWVVLQTTECRTSAMKKTKELLTAHRLWTCRDAYPYELSGGLAQRLALCRTFAYRPTVLLLDEPFSHLDPWVVRPLWEYALAEIEHTRITTVLCTHSVDEAIIFGDTIYVLSPPPTHIVEKISTRSLRPKDMRTLWSADDMRLREQILRAIERIQYENDHTPPRHCLGSASPLGVRG